MFGILVEATVDLSSVQNPSLIPLYWLVCRGPPIGLKNDPQRVKGSRIHELIINQQRYLAATAHLDHNSMGISGSYNGSTVPYKAIFFEDITLHRP